MRDSNWLFFTALASTLFGIEPTPAADLPYKAAAVIGNWTGFYVGVNAGGAFGPTSADTFGMGFAVPNFPLSTSPFDLRHDLTGGFGGLQVGANWQFNNVVLGVETDVQGASISGARRIAGASVACVNFPVCGLIPGNFVTASERIDAFGTFRGRAGFLATPNLLLYGTGGALWADVKMSGDYHFGVPLDFPASITRFRSGWTAGAGFEYKFTGAWSVKGEYLYYDLGSSSIVSGYGTPSTGVLQTQYNFNTHASLARVGVNYEWGASGGPLTAYAAEMPVKVVKAPPPVVSPWEVEVGARYFYSSGRTRFTLGDPFVRGQINSQLTYKDLGSNAGEAFARVDHASGFFAKGFAGVGNIFKRTMNDEDFLPGALPYSNTVSNVNNGALWYGTADAGYNFWRSPTFKVGGFVGYNHFYENVNAFGCTQVATNPFICGIPISGAVAGLSKTEDWDSLRVGVNSVISLAPQWKLTFDGAYLPVVHLSGFDNHWLRPDINPLPQSGNGWGYQLEGIIAYDVTRNISVGAGARYWYAKTTNGTTQFPGAIPPSPTTFESERYGGFLQASYKFDELATVAAKY